LVLGAIAFVVACAVLPGVLQQVTPPPTKIKIWIAATTLKEGTIIDDHRQVASEQELLPKDVQDSHIRVGHDLDGKRVVRTLRPGDPFHHNDLAEPPKPMVVPAGMVKKTCTVPAEHAIKLLVDQKVDLIELEKIHSKYHGKVLMGGLPVLQVEVTERGDRTTIAIREREVAIWDEVAKQKKKWRLVPTGTMLRYVDDLNKFEEMRNEQPKADPKPVAPGGSPPANPI
jgi:hypothetical protein